MSAQPLVTVVIPCYNQGRYVGDAIASVKRQTYTRLEIIVVDDGSTDECAQIAESADVRVLRQANAGLAAARNAGLNAARGEFIVFLDADDELLPDAVESGVAVLRDRPDLACVVRRCQVMDAERRALPTNYSPVDSTDLYREWLQQNFAWTPGAVLFRTAELAAIGGFPPGAAAASDYAVYLALARNSAATFDPRDAVRYRQHNSNMSCDPVLMLRATLAVLREERRHMPPRYAPAYRVGLRRWRVYYGEQIIERLRRERRAGTSGPWQRSAVWTLVTRCPTVFVIHAARKLSRLVRGVPAGPIEPGRFGPEVPAPSKTRQSS